MKFYFLLFSPSFFSSSPQWPHCRLQHARWRTWRRSRIYPCSDHEVRAVELIRRFTGRSAAMKRKVWEKCATQSARCNLASSCFHIVIMVLLCIQIHSNTDIDRQTDRHTHTHAVVEGVLQEVLEWDEAEKQGVFMFNKSQTYKTASVQTQREEKTKQEEWAAEKRRRGEEHDTVLTHQRSLSKARQSDNEEGSDTMEPDTTITFSHV